MTKPWAPGTYHVTIHVAVWPHYFSFLVHADNPAAALDRAIHGKYLGELDLNQWPLA